ncbi:SDR family NAD(P)-dependent oxidoreductase [Sphingobium sp. OAS761]|uniref:SDR family NAD(P)-dependent oxidoreductase n=1 Tax=Sphingobium sp. OAS761 TaxID=2817901 RepID=UPI00209C858A|nr:SDR family NAD(P)-dependent oxidoreductase [Sphingobium sp. OAS761]
MQQVALVVGATRGIGRAIASALGRAGFAIVVTGRTMVRRPACMTECASPYRAAWPKPSPRSGRGRMRHRCSARSPGPFLDRRGNRDAWHNQHSGLFRRERDRSRRLGPIATPCGVP